MSTDYHKEIYSTSDVVLKVNFTGIKEGIADTSSLAMAIFAYDAKTGRAIFNEKLNFQQVQGLYQHLHQISIIRDSSITQSGKFIEATDDLAKLIESIKELSGDAVAALLNTFESNEKIGAVLGSLSPGEMNSLSAAHKHHTYKQAVEALELLLELEMKGEVVKEIINHPALALYSAKQPEKIFQNWIEKNLWVFGVEYAKHYDARKIAIFSEADLLMESLDGYLDLIELKRPRLDYKIFKYDSSHHCYYPSSDLSQVIGQSLFYLQKMDDYKINLEKEHKVKILRPRIKILLGRTSGFNEDQYHALRMLNSNLSSIQVYSYDYLVSSAKKMIAAYE